MSDNNAQKNLTGPFQNKRGDGYYMYDKDGNQIAVSTDLLFSGTVTAVVMEEEIQASVPAPDANIGMSCAP